MKSLIAYSSHEIEWMENGESYLLEIDKSLPSIGAYQDMKAYALTVIYFHNYWGRCILDLLEDFGCFKNNDYPLSVEEVKEFDAHVVRGNFVPFIKDRDLTKEIFTYVYNMVEKALKR